jgi:hypothetical protein
MRPLIATALFAAYWLPIVWGFVDLDRGEWPVHTRELFFGELAELLVLTVPSVLAGVVAVKLAGLVRAALSPSAG